MPTADSPDIIEDTIRKHNDLLDVLLLDRTRTTARKPHNILWATNSYPGHNPKSEISIDDITGDNTNLIQPRIAKSREEQKRRSQEKAEVFTPRWVVNQMNQQTDWNCGHWPVTEDNWQDYVSELRLEITCGEAPFIVGRYNAASGKKVLKLSDRVGFLDRKLQVVSKYCHDKADWLQWAIVAFQCSYGYEWQGDNLLLARENLLYTFIDYWNDKFPDDQIDLDQQLSENKANILRQINEVISWNIFQMDGINYIVPMSGTVDPETPEVPPLLSMLGERHAEPKRKKPIYVKIMDWRKRKTIKFIDIVKGKK